jgi:lipid-A-disaccharide synthase
MIPECCDIFICAGEKSGDLLGGKLLQALYAQKPTLSIQGVGGATMRSTSMHCFFPMEELQVMGFIDVFCAFPRLRRLFYTVAKEILRLNPKVVVTIDYPGFNLRLAKYLRKQGFRGKLVHFVCPSVWAWGKRRIPLMGKTLDLLLCILPFEKKLFAHTPLRTVFVGNPLAERVRSHVYKPFPTDKPLLSLFPGSRAKEIERNLSVMLDAARHAQQKHPPLRLALSISEERFRPLMREILKKKGWKEDEVMWVGAGSSYELMKASHLAIAKSGTVTLELALHKIPTVVIYALSFLDRLIAQYILRIRLPFYCLVNIIAGHRVFAELIGPHLTPFRLEKEVEALFDEPTRFQIQKECDLLIGELSGKHPSELAAREILNFS